MKNLKKIQLNPYTIFLSKKDPFSRSISIKSFFFARYGKNNREIQNFKKIKIFENPIRIDREHLSKSLVEFIDFSSNLRWSYGGRP